MQKTAIKWLHVRSCSIYINADILHNIMQNKHKQIKWKPQRVSKHPQKLLLALKADPPTERAWGWRGRGSSLSFLSQLDPQFTQSPGWLFDLEKFIT